MTLAPDFLLRHPAMPTDPAVLAGFDRLFDQATADGSAPLIDYNLPQPRWQFICHLADTRQVVLHGSPDPDITVFEPRQPQDSTVFGNQKAVYAASDGLWPMYFAILDRSSPVFMINAAMRFARTDGNLSDPHYYFSISQRARASNAFRPGTIYVLPRDSFMQQPAEVHDGETVHIPQWASLVPVKPLAKIAVEPGDFPLLDQIRGHDDDATFSRIKANPAGFPWLED